LRSRAERNGIASPRRAAWRLALAAALAAPWLPAHAQAADAPAAAASGPHLDAAAVQGALDAVRRDPNFGGERTERVLRWKRDDKPNEPTEPPPPWLAELARWLATAGRGVAWLLLALAVALLLVFAWRWSRVRADAAAGRAAAVPPSHVHDLDIRPESLPDDVAGAARALWQRGEQRAALSLLYRGALSRLVHERGVAIEASSTEGECVERAQQVLAADDGAYVERLVRAWQVAVYAARWPDDAQVQSLCDDFDRHLAPRPSGTGALPAQAAAA